MRPGTIYRVALVMLALSGSVGLALLIWGGIGLLTRGRIS